MKTTVDKAGRVVIPRSMPPGTRRSPAVVGAILGANFPATRFLEAEQSADLCREHAESGLAGGAVYDALVGAAARTHGSLLLSRDHRARCIYEVLGVNVRLIGEGR